MGNSSSSYSDPGDYRYTYYVSPSGSDERVYATRSVSRPRRRTTRRTRPRPGRRRHRRGRRRSPNSAVATVIEQILGDGPSPQLRRFLAATENHPRGPRSDGSLAEVRYREYVSLPRSRARAGQSRRSYRIRMDGNTYRVYDEVPALREMNMRRASPRRGLRLGDTYFDCPDSNGYRPMRMYDPTQEVDPARPCQGIYVEPEQRRVRCRGHRDFWLWEPAVGDDEDGGPGPGLRGPGLGPGDPPFAPPALDNIFFPRGPYPWDPEWPPA